MIPGTSVCPRVRYWEGKTLLAKLNSRLIFFLLFSYISSQNFGVDYQGVLVSYVFGLKTYWQSFYLFSKILQRTDVVLQICHVVHVPTC